MITLFAEENKPLTPEYYNELISELQICLLPCTCGHTGGLTVHAYYKRSVKLNGDKITFRICRVKCEYCGHTHALLLSSMIPYSQISTADHVSIINNYTNNLPLDSVMNNNPAIDEGNCRYIIKSYLRHWKEKLLSEGIKLISIQDLIKACFKAFSRQFMQIKTTSNILFLNTT